MARTHNPLVWIRHIQVRNTFDEAERALCVDSGRELLSKSHFFFFLWSRIEAGESILLYSKLGLEIS